MLRSLADGLIPQSYEAGEKRRYVHGMAAQNVAAKKRRAWTTSVFIKQLMTVLGFVFVFSLLFHSYGNLRMFPGAEIYNDYAHWSYKEVFMPIFPHGGFIWIFRAAMVLMLIIHLQAATYTWKRSRRARSTRYVVKKSVSDSYVARAMRMSGIFILLILIFHIAHLTTIGLPARVASFSADVATSYIRMVASFQSPVLVIPYAVLVGRACIHVSHGFWSMFQSLGWMRNAAREPLVLLSDLIGLVIFVMFMAPPVAIITGLIY